MELREMIMNDRRFSSTDSAFNNFSPATFFKGNSKDKGPVKSTPDSIQFMLVYGDAALVTEKGGQEDFDKHPMILKSSYFYSNKDSLELEYNRLLEMVYPVFTDTSAINNDIWESDYSNDAQKGRQKCKGKIFESFDPYYRVSISNISYIPDDGSIPAYVLDIVFSKEDI
ncbi:MAG: hypothetical protein K1X54_12105 [Flavobacteriales bacterium]|nr:hypothetical protein [Flavobacteriales bacterium]